MTCIVGIVHEGKVYLGADSAGSTNDFIATRKEPKAFKINNFGFAYTSSFRMGDLLHYSFVPPVFDEAEETLDRYMRTKFIAEIKHTFAEGGFGNLAKDSGGAKEEDTGGDFLVGIAGRLFSIEDDYQVAEYRKDYYADGSGYQYALGSLYSTKEENPRDRVRKALKASAEFSPSVSAPFTIISV
jgi:hypothetical protein